MSIGLILLIVVTLLVLFGVAQRVLDRLRLTDRQALLFVGLLFVGGLLPDIPVTPMLSVNIGGALVPLGLCIYLLAKAGSRQEVVRALIASLNSPRSTAKPPSSTKKKSGPSSKACCVMCSRPFRVSSCRRPSPP